MMEKSNKISRDFVAVKFRLPKHRGKSVVHIRECGKFLSASMYQKGVMLTWKQILPNRVRYDYERNLWMNCRHVYCSKQVDTSELRYYGEPLVMSSAFDALQSPADSRNLSLTRNGIMERGNCYQSSQIWENDPNEKAANRKPGNSRIVSEAKAWGNAQDKLTETQWYGR